MKISLPWYTASVVMMGFCIVLYHQSGNHLKAEATKAALHPVYTSAKPAFPDGVRTMVGGRKVFVGGQLNAEDLTNFLATFQIDHVIDLAHEAKAEAILTGTDEARIAAAAGATYWPVNIEGKGALNQKALAQVDSIIDSGEVVFVHCLHGIHRVGVAAGRAYARDLRRWDDIVMLLGWEAVVADTKYRKYVRDVYEQTEKNAK